MSTGVLGNLLDTAGFAAADCPQASDAVRLSRLSRPDESKAGQPNPLKTKAVPPVPPVPPGKGEVVGKGERENVSHGHGVERGVGRVQEESSARNSGRERLCRIAEAEGLDTERVMTLDDAEAGELEHLADNVLRAYARALLITAERKAGRVPEGSTQVVRCAGCGPVWLEPGSPEQVIACPWCLVRMQGVSLPVCPAVPKGSEQ